MNETGTAILEFALVIPLLLILLFGIIEFGFVLYDKAMITNACREGARRGIVYRFDPDETAPQHPTDSEIISVITAYLQNHLITFGDPLLQTQITREGDSSGDELTVIITYGYDFLLLPSFLTSMTGSINLAAKTIMRME